MSEYTLGATSPPPDRPSPLAAGLSGLCLGPVGTAWNVGTSHALLTGAAYFAATIAWGNRGMLLGLIGAGIYGAGMVAFRNARHDAAQRQRERADARAAAEGMARLPLVLDAVPVVIELEAAAVLPPAGSLAVPAEPGEVVPPAPAIPVDASAVPVPVAEDPRPVAEDDPAASEARPEPSAPVELPAVEAAPVPAAEVEPPSPPAPPAPRKRGRPRKLAA